MKKVNLRTKTPPEIFRLYDIRGVYPQDLDEELAYQIGRCFICFLRKKQKKKKLKIGIARDIRPSSPILFKGFSEGIRDEGCDIVDFGLITTPMLYFAVSYFGYNGGAIITASHNPNPWNGLKLTGEKAVPLSGNTGIFWMRNHLAKHSFSKEKTLSPSTVRNVISNGARGKIIKKNIERTYLNLTFKLAKVKKNEFKTLNVAVDAGNGVAGPIALKILEKAGTNVYPLYCQPDGSFPNHVPDPLLKQNLGDIVALIRKKKPTLGFALDGDGDRIVFIDEMGRAIPGDLITALMARIILRDKFGEKILYDIRSSNVVREVISGEGGVPVCYKIGHALIKEKMRREKAVFAGELSGHYYLGKNLFYEVPFFVLLKILKEIKEKGAGFSNLIKPYRKYYHSGEINFEVENKERKIRELKNLYSNGKILEIDGLRVDFKDWWFLVRPSHTEPLLRLVIEAKTKKLMEKKKKELSKLISQT